VPNKAYQASKGQAVQAFDARSRTCPAGDHARGPCQGQNCHERQQARVRRHARPRPPQLAMAAIRPGPSAMGQGAAKARRHHACGPRQHRPPRGRRIANSPSQAQAAHKQAAHMRRTRYTRLAVRTRLRVLNVTESRMLLSLQCEEHLESIIRHTSYTFTRLAVQARNKPPAAGPSRQAAYSVPDIAYILYQDQAASRAHRQASRI
jgi:hypothetical protein